MPNTQPAKGEDEKSVGLLVHRSQVNVPDNARLATLSLGPQLHHDLHVCAPHPSHLREHHYEVSGAGAVMCLIYNVVCAC